MTKKLLAMLLFLVATQITFARKFYFSSSTGNDTYTTTQAQNPTTPWQTLKKIQYYTTSGRILFQPGDTLAFKRGDVFANGYSNYVSVFWWNVPNQPSQSTQPQYFTAPSGTATNPIVITNYGDSSLPLPNWLHPNSTISTTNTNNVIGFAGVRWIVIDGIQFNDTRFPLADKTNPSPVCGAIILGEYTKATSTTLGSGSDTANRKYYVKNCIVKNCTFNNVAYAFAGIAAEDTKLMYNTITNLKSTIDTAGTYDVMAGAFEGMNCDRCEISHNYVKGAWAKSGRVSSTYGLGGVGLDMFNCRNTRITYNTFIDCSGMFEIGSIDYLDTTVGCKYDTFAFNKVINCGNMGYIHGSTGSFVGNNRNIAIFNNVVINNNKSRMNGPSFGSDIYNDGQSFNQWWFFRNPLKCPNNALSVSDTTWSNPIHPTVCNRGGHRFVVQYASDQIRGNADTLIDSRNNIFYSTVGDQMIYDATRTKYKHTNNVYYIKGVFITPTSLGGTLGTNERIINTRIFADTSSIYPENWDLHLVDTSYANGNGSYIPGLTEDFEGHPLPITGQVSIGLYQKMTVLPIPNCTFTYGQWTSCNGAFQTRTYTSLPNGCSGLPPLDSIQRPCTPLINITSFYYNQSRQAIYINCNTSGLMVITTLTGNVVRSASYQSNGQWISVRSLPRGTYIAATYGRSMLFTK
jgi:hypothetical protein